jgi:hypothetical protein
MIELNTENNVRDNVKYILWDDVKKNLSDNFIYNVRDYVSNNVRFKLWDGIRKNILIDLKHHTKQI